MSRLRICILGLATVCAVGMFSVAVASAANPAWKIQGKKLGPQVKRQIKITSGETSELKGKVAGSPTVIICTVAVAPNSYIEGNGTGAGQAGTTGITFSSCKTTVNGGKLCAVNEPIVTKQLKSHLITYGEGQGKIGEIFEPSQGEEYVGLSFKNNEGTCPLPPKEVFPVKGSVVAELKTKTQTQEQEPLEAVVGELAFPTQPISKVKLEGQEKKVELAVGGNAGAVFSGKFEAQLVVLEQKLEPFGVFYG